MAAKKAKKASPAKKKAAPKKAVPKKQAKKAAKKAAPKKPEPKKKEVKSKSVTKSTAKPVAKSVEKVKPEAKKEGLIKRKDIDFNTLTSSEKRVQVAKDALAIIGSKIIPHKGTYVYNPQIRANENLKTVLETKDIKCATCIKGGLFVAYILRVNEFTTHNSATVHHEHLVEKLSDVFSIQQLNLMETAFERQVVMIKDVTLNKNAGQAGKMPFSPTLLAERAIQFGKRYDDYQLRFEAILHNIVENNGEFKP